MDNNNPYLSYLDVLGSVQGSLEQLTELTIRKTEIVKNDDLMALNEVLNQEQALALAFRGLEQKREKLLADMGLSDVPLSQLPGHFPPEAREAAEHMVQALEEQYKNYRGHADSARGLLERSLHEIEQTLSQLGASPSKGPGYEAKEAEPPKTLKTDFRA